MERNECQANCLLQLVAVGTLRIVVGIVRIEMLHGCHIPVVDKRMLVEHRLVVVAAAVELVAVVELVES